MASNCFESPYRDDIFITFEILKNTTTDVYCQESEPD